MGPAMHQAEAVTRQKGAGAEAVGVEGLARGAEAREAKELLQRAKVGRHIEWSSIPICTIMHS